MVHFCNNGKGWGVGAVMLAVAAAFGAVTKCDADYKKPTASERNATYLKAKGCETKPSEPVPFCPDPPK